MKFKKLLFMFAAAALATSNAQADQLRVGVEGAYPPFSWKEADGTLKGFDIDFANEVCKRLNKECVLVEQEWDGMIPALLAKSLTLSLRQCLLLKSARRKLTSP